MYLPRYPPSQDPPWRPFSHSPFSARSVGQSVSQSINQSVNQSIRQFNRKVVKCGDISNEDRPGTRPASTSGVVVYSSTPPALLPRTTCVSSLFFFFSFLFLPPFFSAGQRWLIGTQCTRFARSTTGSSQWTRSFNLLGPARGRERAGWLRLFCFGAWEGQKAVWLAGWLRKEVKYVCCLRGWGGGKNEGGCRSDEQEVICRGGPGKGTRKRVGEYVTRVLYGFGRMRKGRVQAGHLHVQKEPKIAGMQRQAGCADIAGHETPAAGL
ncbi:hypothetical protein IWX49DRAFT_572591 [Phyllosticta citricarpa]